MKHKNKTQNRWLSISIVLLLASSLIACESLKQAQLEKQARVREAQQKRYLTLERSDAKISVSPDGLEIASDHYTLTFAEDLQKHEDFDEPEERQNMGSGALVFMESLYDYVHKIFGFGPQHRIHVTLHQTYRGTTNMATTTIHHRPIYRGREFIGKEVQAISMDFPMAMYNSRGTRAHELTHAFTNIYLLPTWFAEGIAVLVQVEYAKDRSKGKVDLYDDLKIDHDGVNQVQTWEGHLTLDNLTIWRYNYSYSIVSELQRRFGEDFYPEVFRLIEADRLHQKLPGRMSTSFLVYYLGQAAGQDLTPFFNELKFNVRKLTRNEILTVIEQTTE